MFIEFQLSKTFITDFNPKPAIPREDSDIFGKNALVSVK
jgi:hypothetical protein